MLHRFYTTYYPLSRTPSSLMSEDKTYSIWCLIDGESQPFTTLAKVDDNVDELKRAIKLENGSLREVGISDLKLYKLNSPMLVQPVVDLAKRIQVPITDFAVALEEPTLKMSAIFAQYPSKEHLYIIVKRSTDTRPFKRSRLSPSYPSAPLNASPRKNTVAALYERLKRYAFIQVRGTPASGKTVLAQLLADHISRQDPDVHIIWVYGWPLREVEESGNYRSYLKQQGWLEGEKTVFIFDEAQLSYEDPQLWGEFFRSMHDHGERRAIVFGSYGSPASHIDIKGTPMVIPDPQRVTLCHVEHEDGLSPAGLLFTRIEFNDLVIKRYPSSKFCFHESFFNALFDVTNGHVGAIHDFIGIIIAEHSYRKLKQAAGGLYTWDSFLAEVSPRDLLRKLENSASIFGRGLPLNRELQAPTTTRIFSTVLCRNVVIKADFKTRDEKDALKLCYHNGWLHVDKLGIMNLPDDVGYYFPSSLHRWYVEWKLSDSIPPTRFQTNNLLDFVIDIIRLFSPNHLSAERRIGPGGIQRLPEAQYQDELYCCCHALSRGSLVTFPEFGTAKGRVDFYIPAKSWGIELLRDGNQLEKHCGRFSATGLYGTTLPLSDYIIVDCRTTRPKDKHQYLSKLYHAVFEDNFQNVSILDNRHHPVNGGKFRLSAS